MALNLLEPTVNGRRLSEFVAKMQSYPMITAAQPITETFKGAHRSSMQLLSNRRGAMHLECFIDFYGSNVERTQHRSEFDALLIGREPVTIDINDGYFYRAVCEEIGEPYTERELLTTVKYRFQVTRHRTPVEMPFVLGKGAADTFFCESNVERTDCVLTLHPPAGGISGFYVTLNGLTWSYAPELTGNLVLDGVNKTFTENGANVAALLRWTDFPFLVPGQNRIQFGWSEGIGLDILCDVAYTPTFL